MYSGRIAPILSPAVELYEKASGFEVKTRYGDSPSLAATLVEEGKNSPADLFFAQDAGSLDAVEKKGLLLKLPADILAKVPKQYQSQAGRWVGTTGRSRVIAYGEKLEASELPDSPLKLTEARWKGRVGWAPTNASHAGLHHGAAARRGRGRREAVARGHGRQRRPGLRLEHPRPRRDRQGRDRRSA